MSTHSVNVIRVGEVLPHPNADKLEITRIDGYTCLIPKGTYKPGDMAAYIEPDYVVPDTEQFAYLKGKRRIGAVRLRGIWSEGLLVQAPPGSVVGDNVMNALGITRWEPPAEQEHRGPPIGLAASVPDWVRTAPKYDLENLKKYDYLLTPGEYVLVTEKLHGTNARYMCHAGQMYCGSRTQWRKPEPTNVYWEALKQNPEIEAWCMDHPNQALVGEVYGAVQDLRYGATNGEYRFAAFDTWDGTFWWSAHKLETVPTVPLLGEVPYDLDQLKEWAEHDSVYGGIREGLVVQPVQERACLDIGRVKLKLVSNRYLSR